MIKILIAEDETKSRETLAARLRDLLGDRALVETAADGAEAVARAGQVKPDLILMDIEMPKKNGLEAAAVIKAQMPRTRVVFLTAYNRFDYAVSAMRSGGEDYLLKPVSEQDLTELLHKLFGIDREEKEVRTPFETSLRVWIKQHYQGDVALEDCASAMGFSAFYFSRQMKAVTGKTFLEYLTEYRIEKAKRRLADTDLPVNDVGKAVGYPDANYFTKVFKRAVGETPSVYRAHQRQD